MNYRVATSNDIDAIAQLHANSWRRNYRGIFSDQYLDGDLYADRAAVWQKRLTHAEPNQIVLVAESNESVVGFVCAYLDKSPTQGTFVDNLHVEAVYSGKGIGSKLLSMVAVLISERGNVKRMHLEVLEDNKAAIRFYERLGGSHYSTGSWLPPGSTEEVNDCVYVWNSLAPLLTNH